MIATRPAAYRCVLFDFDGTLADTRRVDELALSEARRRLGLKDEQVRLFWELDGVPLVERLHRVDPSRASELLTFFTSPAGVRSFAGLRGVLAALRERGLRLGLVSSRRGQTLPRYLRRLRLGAFDVVVALEDVRQPKPSPEPVLLALKRLGADPGEAVYVGDTPIDAAAARGAGVAWIGALWGRSGDPADAALPPPLARRPADLLGLILPGGG
jgi:pyrophosphatase PpaX